MIREKRVKSGGWKTLELFWNATGAAFFRAPAGATIRVRYGVGFFSTDRQKQTLDGTTYKKLSVGKASIARAKMQIRVSETTDMTYDVYPGEVAIKTPKIRF